MKQLEEINASNPQNELRKYRFKLNEILNKHTSLIIRNKNSLIRKNNNLSYKEFSREANQLT